MWKRFHVIVILNVPRYPQALIRPFKWYRFNYEFESTCDRGSRNKSSQITRLMGPTWGPPGSWRLQVGPVLAPWTLLSGMFNFTVITVSTNSQWWLWGHIQTQPRWRHNMETLSNFLRENTGGFPSQRASSVECWFLLAVSLNTLWDKQSSCRWFEPPCSSYNIL